MLPSIVIIVSTNIRSVNIEYLRHFRPIFYTSVKQNCLIALQKVCYILAVLKKINSKLSVSYRGEKSFLEK